MLRKRGQNGLERKKVGIGNRTQKRGGRFRKKGDPLGERKEEEWRCTPAKGGEKAALPVGLIRAQLSTVVIEKFSFLG